MSRPQNQQNEQPFAPPTWVHCNRCMTFGPTAHAQSGSATLLYILECTHVLCESCHLIAATSSSTVVCPVCNSSCATRPIGHNQLQSDVLSFFDSQKLLAEYDRVRYSLQVCL
ncbi:hypothetical protein GGI26_001396 [Coemansia sp. RSA 1358]|nr:hypothetical protein GGI26_001396 [Coemansia sp. RSA 1358]